MFDASALRHKLVDLAHNDARPMSKARTHWAMDDDGAMDDAAGQWGAMDDAGLTRVDVNGALSPMPRVEVERGLRARGGVLV